MTQAYSIDMTDTNMLRRTINRVFRRHVQTPEAKRRELLATVIADMALMVLVSAARAHESGWSDKTRFTLLGYLIRSAEESMPNATVAEHEHIAALAYQRLCSSLVVHSELVARLARLEADQDPYYLAGLEAATYDRDAASKGQVVHAFFDALQFPQNFRTGDMNAQGPHH